MVDDGCLSGNVTLEELFADPIVWLVMKSDRVTKQEISEILNIRQPQTRKRPGASPSA